MDHCIRHYEEPYLANCRNCQRPFCSRCLVFSFGPKKPPYCIGCALTASGVRNAGKTVVAAAPAPKVDKRVEKAQRKAAKEQARLQARAAKAAAKQPGGQPEVADVRTTTVPAPPKLTTPASRFSRRGSERAIS